ncbi:HTH domain-containing protein [Carboxylicivirga marina]|uniref:HTH domain-containing protein n=1 Tax=Carboxylicivirga marina TaxID=2800988 RepID=A0ABS1HPG9_9BACT|nr:HTH domain-containing protein [Carboxylicivirga marina]MBK3519541.1 HTH domain-containing protein [Carboxylicivirga marina]
MKFIMQMERYERILHLIKRKATGTPQELAKRLNISESSLYDYLRVLKAKGADIEYSNSRQSYVLNNDFVITFGNKTKD